MDVAVDDEAGLAGADARAYAAATEGDVTLAGENTAGFSQHLNADGSYTDDYTNSDGSQIESKFDQKGNWEGTRSCAEACDPSSGVGGDDGVGASDLLRDESVDEGDIREAQAKAQANRPTTPQGPGDENGGSGGSGSAGGEPTPTVLRPGGAGARLPMNMDTVNSVADKYGIDLSTNDIQINKSIAGLRGSTAPDQSITL